MYVYVPMAMYIYIYIHVFESIEPMSQFQMKNLLPENELPSLYSKFSDFNFKDLPLPERKH